MNRRIALSLASFALAAAAHAADAPSMPANDKAAGQLLQKHLAAFIANDLDAVVSDYASDAVFVAPDGTYEGPARIREFFRNLMAQFPKGASTLALDRTELRGDLIYFTWHGKTPTLEVPFATDTMVVRGGKIVKQTFAGVLQPLKRQGL